MLFCPSTELSISQCHLKAGFLGDRKANINNWNHRFPCLGRVLIPKLSHKNRFTVNTIISHSLKWFGPAQFKSICGKADLLRLYLPTPNGLGYTLGQPNKLLHRNSVEELLYHLISLKNTPFTLNVHQGYGPLLRKGNTQSFVSLHAELGKTVIPK